MNSVRKFWNDDQGQDLIEYSLLMSFVALASAGLFLIAGGSIRGIWTASNSQLNSSKRRALVNLTNRPCVLRIWPGPE